MQNRVFMAMLFIACAAVLSQTSAADSSQDNQSVAKPKKVDGEQAVDQQAGEGDTEAQTVDETHGEARPASQDGESEEKEQPADEKNGEKEVKLTCYFVAELEERTILRPLEWKSFPIKSVVEHGSQVTRGDTIISFDSF